MRKPGLLALTTLAILVAAAPGVSAQTAGAPDPTRGDVDPIERQLLSEGWEFVGDVSQRPAKLGEGEAMVVLADNRAFRLTGLPTDRPDGPDTRPGGTSASISAADLRTPPGRTGDKETGKPLPPVNDFSLAPTEPSGVLLGPTDERSYVWNGLTTYPMRTIGSLSGNPNGGTGCTGTLVGPRHVITAAHCLYNDQGVWFTNVYFNPGQLGATDPNGAPRKMVARYARTWSLGDDYGLVILADESRTAKLGWMGMRWSSVGEYLGIQVRNNGYPLSNQQCADSPLENGTCGGYMYEDYCNVQTATATYLMYDCDTSGGHSGSAVWKWFDDGPSVLGVHKRGNEPSSGAVFTSDPANANLGPRMRPTMFNDICGWMKNFPSKFAAHAICS